MKQLSSGRNSKQIAFTLIELLVVIAIIAILSALLIPVGVQISQKRMKSVARAELEQVATAIDNYKSKYSFFPPDNPTNTRYNPLFYELVGTILTNDAAKNATSPVFLTLDGQIWIATNAIRNVLGVDGFANSSTSMRGSDERPAPKSFMKDLKAVHIGTNGAALLLLCSQEWTKPGSSGPNPWNYNSSNPTNNPGSYDLWVDLYIAGKTNRICNWSKQPIIW